MAQGSAPADREFLGGIVVGYGHLHAFELSKMAHEPGGPWDRVWNAPGGRISLGMRISNATIREHFRRRIAVHQNLLDGRTHAQLALHVPKTV